jgi:starch-binding outer membrane protein, SusD/RagB family
MFHNENKRLSGARLLATLSLSAALFWGCLSRDFPNPNSTGEADAAIQSLVSGTEGSMRNGLNFYYYGMSLIGREGYYLGGDDPRFMAEYVGGAIDPGGPFGVNSWTARYAAINNANVLLERAAALPPALRGQQLGLQAFAQTVIAYQLLLNINQFNENGIKIGFSRNPAEFPFVSRTAALQEITRLLDLAYVAIQDTNAVFPFVLSPGFAAVSGRVQSGRYNRALRARVAAYQGDYAACQTALALSFLDTAASMNLGVFHAYSTGTGDQTNPIFEPPLGAARFWAQNNFFSDNQDTLRDLRLQKASVTTNRRTAYGITATRNITLYSSPTSPIPIIRNEELLLLRAEANALGSPRNYAAATADINRVRAAAGVPLIALLTTDSAATARILYERRYSLFCEGHRWVDMRRFNRLNELPLERSGDRMVVSFPRPILELP